jgi:NADP-dependent 3-hydroxy acid dehydrogenase YdfG
MNQTLTNKVAIITGASSGIGRATAILFAQHGARLALGSRNREALESLAEEIRSLRGEAMLQVTDVTQRGQVNELVQATLQRWGQVDILVSNAGQYIRCPITKLTPKRLEESMAVNFYGHVYAILAVLPQMLARHSGNIVLVATMDAKKGLTPDAPYVSAKFALSGFNEVLRQELYRTGVHTTIAYPGRVDTPMIEDLKVPWISAKISPEAVAKAILKGIRRGRKEIFQPPQVLLLHYANALFPSFADWAARVFHLEGWNIPKDGSYEKQSD